MYRARSAEESAALERLRERLLSSGEFSSSAAGRRMLASFGGGDLCLLRFLRARELDVAKAAEALTATLAFRNENGVGAPQTVAAVRSEGVADWWCGTFAGTTSTGCPVTYWRFRCIEADQLKQRFDDAQLNRFYAAWMERGLALQREAAVSGNGCPGMVDIYDMEGVRWGQMSSGVRLLSGVLSVAQAHYPENLSQAFLINAPSFFAGAWRLISGVIDKRTQQKFAIRKDGAAGALDAVLGSAAGPAGTARRESIWQIGDRQLGGGSDEVVRLSAECGWRHERSLVVGPNDCANGHGSGGGTGRRLLWCFDLEGERERARLR